MPWCARRRIIPRIVGLTADLGKYTDIHLFRGKIPGAFFSDGHGGTKSYRLRRWNGASRLDSLCNHLLRLCHAESLRFIAIGVALGRANVKIIAGLPGLTTGYGGTHQGIEDLALMCSVPNLTVIDPCDATEIEQASRRLPIMMDRFTCACCVGKFPSYWIRNTTNLRLAKPRC